MWGGDRCKFYVAECPPDASNHTVDLSANKDAAFFQHLNIS